MDKPLEREISYYEILCRPEMTYEKLMSIVEFGPKLQDHSVAKQIEIELKYAGYIVRQAKEIERSARYDNLKIPRDFNYSEISGLSKELQKKS